MTVKVDLPIEAIRQRFQLNDLEIDALLHCIAAELHPGYGRVFAYLNNDLTRQRPSIALLVDVLSSNWSERLAARRALGPDSTLFRSGLLIVSRPGSDHLAAELAVDPAVLDFVLDSPSRQDPAPPSQAPTIEALLVSGAERRLVEQITAQLNGASQTSTTTLVLISGAPGAGRRTCAAAICQALRWRLRPWGKDQTAASVFAEAPQRLRDTRLAGDVPGIYAPNPSAEEPAHLPALIDLITNSGVRLAFLFIEAEEPVRAPASSAAQVLRLHLSTPKAAQRTQAWTRALSERGLRATPDTVDKIAAVYPFNVGRIHTCAQEASVRLGSAGSEPLDLPGLAQICREQTHHRLERLAQPLPTRHGWGDIVLPPDEMSRLKEIADAVRNRDRVMDDWGFGQKVSAGPGVNAIFFGPSGTGKTMAASIVAAELGMAIYRVDLSRVVSKYIGDTERNLEALFDEAKRSFALLFFDEAEALFGKRSEVKDAHDRYANIEVAYLLQRMEQFEGVSILATNLRKHLDTAFLRRLQFAVEFPLPTAADRLQIWRQVWPAGADLAGDLDLDFMASHLELSGGHIRNVALTAAYLASQAHTAIGMRHLVAATRREMQKLGRGCVPEQFGRYASLFEAGPAA